MGGNAKDTEDKAPASRSGKKRGRSPSPSSKEDSDLEDTGSNFEDFEGSTTTKVGDGSSRASSKPSVAKNTRAPVIKKVRVNKGKDNTVNGSPLVPPPLNALKAGRDSSDAEDESHEGDDDSGVKRSKPKSKFNIKAGQTSTERPKTTKSVGVDEGVDKKDVHDTPKDPDQSEDSAPSPGDVTATPVIILKVDASSLGLPLVQALLDKYTFPVESPLVCDNLSGMFAASVKRLLDHPPLVEVMQKADIRTKVAVSCLRFEFRVNFLSSEKMSAFMVHNITNDHDMQFFQKEIQRHLTGNNIQYPVNCVVVLSRTSCIPEHPVSFGADGQLPPTDHYYHGQFSWGCAHTEDNFTKFAPEDLLHADKWVKSMHPIWSDKNENGPQVSWGEVPCTDPMRLD